MFVVMVMDISIAYDGDDCEGGGCDRAGDK